MRSIIIYLCLRRVEEEDEPAAGPANKRQKQGNQGPRSNYSQGQILVYFCRVGGGGEWHTCGEGFDNWKTYYATQTYLMQWQSDERPIPRKPVVPAPVPTPAEKKEKDGYQPVMMSFKAFLETQVYKVGYQPAVISVKAFL